MIRLSEYIDSILNELGASALPSALANDSPAQPQELELKVPLLLHFRLAESTNDCERNLAFVYDNILLSLQSAKAGLGMAGYRTFLLKEMELLFQRLANPKLNHRRVLRDFCQRVLVYFQEHLSSDTGTRDAEDAQDSFDALTEDLYQRLQGLLAEREGKPGGHEVWVLLNSGGLAPPETTLAGSLTVRYFQSAPKECS